MPHSTTEPTTTPAGMPVPFPRLVAWVLLGCGLVGTVAALALAVEKIAVLRDADHVPSCSLNPILNCGSIMATEQAEVLGFPNPLIGLATLPVLAAVGGGMLAGAAYRRWFWLGLQAGTTVGLAFVLWLIHQSLYVIGALCPYCMVVWVVVIAAFWYVTLTNLAVLRSPTWRRLTTMLLRNHGIVLTLAYLVVLALITVRFWDYWSSLAT